MLVTLISILPAVFTFNIQYKLFEIYFTGVSKLLKKIIFFCIVVYYVLLQSSRSDKKSVFYR